MNRGRVTRQMMGAGGMEAGDEEGGGRQVAEAWRKRREEIKRVGELRGGGRRTFRGIESRTGTGTGTGYKQNEQQIGERA